MTNKEAHIATIKILLSWLTLIALFFLCLWLAFEVTIAIVLIAVIGGTLYSVYYTMYSTLKRGVEDEFY